ncbi:hypothetical protein LMH87_004942 [Akanthomyces muscarius]|uniref:Uncharacterized protein n=1 Tax=Akanthomyces muscarius TaxID=2231603 RepID=A0A9W8QKE2_AKAMU|nr:hypothetical protein LMH87_004942 [Akanthomyces muscarius]KAJ4163199.1 hypothetical protein LMH87_004942 [Akanthomyces muscarius]
MAASQSTDPTGHTNTIRKNCTETRRAQTCSTVFQTSHRKYLKLPIDSRPDTRDAQLRVNIISCYGYPTPYP